MKKRMFVVAVILSLFFALGVVELMSSRDPLENHCSCFDEAPAVAHCQDLCRSRGARCVGVLPWPPALGCACLGLACNCYYRITCNNYTYGYGYVNTGCIEDCMSPPPFD